MPPRSAPTARQVRLGTELRRMRERAGITARGAAAILGSNPMQMSHVESGKSGISEERIRRLAAECACDDAAYVDALVAMATVREKGWWEKYRGIVSPDGLDLADLEHHARKIRTFEVAHIPGLLQTEAHMRAAFQYISPEWPAHDLENLVEFRRARQQAVTGACPKQLDVVIHEAALRIRVGGKKIAQEQLEHILNLSELSTVSVRVVPFENEYFAGAGHSMLHALGPVPQLDTVQIDTGHGGVFIDTEARLNQYRRRFERVADAALSTTDSRDRMSQVINEMREQSS